MTTFAPASASASATANPIPAPAPETIAVRPLREKRGRTASPSLGEYLSMVVIMEDGYSIAVGLLQEMVSGGWRRMRTREKSGALFKNEKQRGMRSILFSNL